MSELASDSSGAVAAVSAAVAAGMSCIAAIVSLCQGRTMRSQLHVGQVANVIALEAQILDAKRAYTEALGRQIAGEGDPTHALEDYLNTLDRFCAYIRWGVISESRYRGDYRQTIMTSRRRISDNAGLDDARFRHIVHVAERWNNDLSALDR